jgi:spectinomycin phosphotransferase
VFPLLCGDAGRWGEPLPAPERDELVTMLAALHGTRPAAVQLAPAATSISWRDDLETTLREVGHPWTGGPLAEPARALVAAAGGQVHRGLARWDRWADAIAKSAGLVITHGEPHPGNVMRTGARTGDRGRTELRLIDWDTAGLALPERDLWLVATEAGEELRRYAELTGRAIDRDALAAYRLRWSLDDISSFARQLRAPHRPTPGAEHALRALRISLSQLPP